MFRLSIAFLFICISAICNSQTENFLFTGITTQEGLSASWVRSIYQDEYGFMWFGTSDGLNRFDGYDIKTFKPDDDSSGTLINGGVNYISERADGLLWICTSQGVNIFNVDQQAFYPFPYLDNERVNHVMTDHLGDIWFSSYSGVYIYSPVDSTMKILSTTSVTGSKLSDNQVYKCYEDRNRNIWIASERGYDIYSRKHDKITPLADGNKAAIDMIEDGNGNIFLAYAAAGIYKINILTSEIGNDPELILFCSANNVIVDSKNRLWVGKSSGEGLSIICLDNNDLSGKNQFDLKSIKNDKRSLVDDAISTIFEDKDGGIWLGTYAGGISYYNPYIKQFNVPHDYPGEIPDLNDKVINCFLADGNFFWIGTEDGLYRYDIRTKELICFLNDPDNVNSIGANGVLSLYKDSRGNLWIGTWNGGLHKFDYRSDQFIRVISDPLLPGRLNNNNIFSIQEDSRGNLWIGTNGGGLNLYNYSTNTYTAFLPDEEDPKSIYHNAVNDICPTSKGELFISVYHSLELFNYDDQSFTHFTFDAENTKSISSGRVLDVFEDSRGNIWIATSSGLNLFNREDKTFRRIGVKDGLPNNTVQSIQEDGNGNLWVSTNNGLSKFHQAVFIPDSFVFTNYNTNDGLNWNEFVRRSSFQHSDGWIYFGGTRGYTFFNPANIHSNPIRPELAITDFELIGTNTEAVSTETDINRVAALELNHEQNDFRIRFTALNYLHPAKNQYKYILEGYEDKWHFSNHQREATYTNIDPGHYTFRIKGSNNDGLWSEKIKSIDIVIHPPWWDTLVFKLLLICTTLLMTYLLYRLRVSSLRRQKQLLENTVFERTSELSDLNTILEERQEEISIQNEELSAHRSNLEKIVNERTKAMEQALKRAEEADKLKSAFLANMSHEIRTPMNAIVGFSTLINSEDVSDEERHEFTEIIANNCNTLMVLINDILDISLIEANQLKLKKQEFDVIRIFNELESYFSMNNHKPIEIRFRPQSKEKSLILNNDPTRFRQVITNLLNNAYKYTEKGIIEFGYAKKNGALEFYVKDTGIGIDESEYQNIFNFFHKIDKHDNQFYRGAGIGLSISNKLVEMMGGKIWLDSKLGEGTVFYLSFPNKALSPSKNPKMLKASLKNESSDLLAGKTIIIAEDEPTNYVLIEKILKKTKAKLIWAKNGKDAVKIIKQLEDHDDCIVIMDIKMPVMNGIRASEKIHKINPGIPIIAVTAYAQSQNREDLLKKNFVDYIAKPLQPKTLLDALSNQVGKSK